MPSGLAAAGAPACQFTAAAWWHCCVLLLLACSAVRHAVSLQHGAITFLQLFYIFYVCAWKLCNQARSLGQGNGRAMQDCHSNRPGLLGTHIASICGQVQNPGPAEPLWLPADDRHCFVCSTAWWQEKKESQKCPHMHVLFVLLGTYCQCIIADINKLIPVPPSAVAVHAIQSVSHHASLVDCIKACLTPLIYCMPQEAVLSTLMQHCRPKGTPTG